MTTEMLSPEAREAQERGRDEAERQLTILTSFLPRPEAIKALRNEAADMARYCWETDRGWVKFSYYQAMKQTYDEALAPL